MKEFGILKSIDLREYWKSEAGDFTPWLAEDENIKLLGETIGLELEVQDQEKSVGPFRADILCLDLSNDSYVLIENQLEKTDHTHLGQLMTYASGLDAVSIVWVAQRFTEEHRAALDWLNSITEDTFNFFGVEVELYKIGDSKAAPLFKVVSKPNNWSRSVKKSAANAKITDTKLLQQEFWTGMKEYIEGHSKILKPQKPLPQHWTNFAIGKSYFYLSASMNTREDVYSVWLNIEGPDALSNYNKLSEKYEEQARAEIDQNMIWDELAERKQSIIGIQNKEIGSINNRDNWQPLFEWYTHALETMTKFFKPKIKALK